LASVVCEGGHMFRPFSKLSKRVTRNERGQSLVEFALSLPLLLLVLSGLLDLGRVYFVYVALEDGAGEGALYLSINPGCRTLDDGTDCIEPNNADFRARNAGNMAVDWSSADIEIDRTDPFGVGDPVKVTIHYPFRLLTPIIPRLLGVEQIMLTVEASQIIVTE
jgi:Flp pilus assembly protein TadG